jgi:hypothetical protein
LRPSQHTDQEPVDGFLTLAQASGGHGHHGIINAPKVAFPEVLVHFLGCALIGFLHDGRLYKWAANAPMDFKPRGPNPVAAGRHALQVWAPPKGMFGIGKLQSQLQLDFGQQRRLHSHRQGILVGMGAGLHPHRHAVEFKVAEDNTAPQLQALMHLG